MKPAYLQSTAPGTSSPRNPKLGSVREVMNGYIRALRHTGARSVRVTLHGIHIYVNGQPYTLGKLKDMTEELQSRPKQSERMHISQPKPRTNNATT